MASSDQEGNSAGKGLKDQETALKEDPISGLFPNEVMEKISYNMSHRMQCRCQVASRGFQTLIKAVQRSQNKWPEFMEAVKQQAPQKYEQIFNALTNFDEKARLVDRANNYYWYQKCPVCMKSKEMEIIKETGTGMTMKCPLCKDEYGCAIVWTYSFNVTPCAECRGKRPKGFTCFNCKKTYCQDCKFYLRALNAYGYDMVCTRCVRECGHACDWAYVVGKAQTCEDCKAKLCARCAEWGSDCLEGSEEEDEENDSEEDDEEEEEDDMDEDEAEDQKPDVPPRN